MLVLAEMAYNTRKHSVTKQAPYGLLLGHMPKTIEQWEATSMVPEAAKCLKQLEHNRKEATMAIERAAKRMSTQSSARWTHFKCRE